MDKIKKVSAALKNIFTFLVLLPVPVAIVMWTYVQFREQSVFGIPIVGGPIGSAVLPYWNMPPVLGDVTLWMRFAGFMVCLPMTLLQVYWIWQLRQLFSHFAHGQIFTKNSTDCLRRTAVTLLAIPLVAIPINSVVGVILTSHNPIGYRVLGVSFGTPQLLDVLTGLVLVVIAWIMNEGQRLQEDAELTV